MKVVLVNPPKIHQVWAGIPDLFNSQDIYLFPPLGIMYLSGYLKKYGSHQVELLDCVADRLTAPEAAQKIREMEPQAVGITTLTHNLADVFSLVQGIKELLPQTQVILGGPHTYVFPRRAAALKGVDAVIRGDGEETLLEWLNCLENRGDKSQVQGVLYREGNEIRENPPRPLSRDLDALPFPDRRALLDKPYFTPAIRSGTCATLISARGCPFRCVFCSTHKTFRQRSASNIVDEILEVVEDLGIKEIYFIDDTFNATPRRVMEICGEILKRGLKFSWGFKASPATVTLEMLKLAKEAGCTKVHYGVETGTQEGLRALGKKATLEQTFEAFKLTRKAGIRSIAYMMMGCPFEKTPQDILQLKDFVLKLNPDYVVHSIFSPYPDAPIFQEGVEKGIYPPDCWDKFIDNPTEKYDLPTCWEEHLNKAQLVEVLKELHRGFYFNPRIVLRTLFSVKTPQELKRILLGGLSLLRFEALNPRDRRI